MSATTRTFDPGIFSIIVGGKIISGYADDTFIKVTRNQQAWDLKVGVDGEGTRSKNLDRSGKYEFTLMMSSPSNDDLTGFALADEASNSGAVPVLVKDGSGRTVFQSTTAWCQKMPDIEKGKTAKTNTWVFESNEVNYFIGGNN